MRPLTTEMHRLDARPYFLWDEDLSVDELRKALEVGSGYEHDRLLGKMLREARDLDVWAFVTPRHVAEALPRIERRLRRRAAFWRFLIEGWQRLGCLRG